MEDKELLELKSEVDELSMYYATIKSEIVKLEEILYANNLAEKEVHENLTDDEIRSKYKSKTLAVYWILYALLILLRKSLKNFAFGLSQAVGNTFELIYILSLLSLVSWYCYCIFKGYQNAPKKYRKKHPVEEEINLEEVKEKLGTLYQRERIISSKYNEYAENYQIEISNLADEERKEYNELVSEYMLELLNTAENKINSSMLISEMDDEVFERDIVKGYELKQ